MEIAVRQSQESAKVAELDRGIQEAELYHLEHDLGKKKNLIKENPEIASRLQALPDKAKP